MLQPFTEGKAVVQLVLPPSWVTRINQLATERGVNRSALIREAIRATYFAEAARGEGERAAASDLSAPSASAGLGDRREGEA